MERLALLMECDHLQLNISLSLRVASVLLLELKMKTEEHLNRQQHVKLGSHLKQVA